jgi:hypothetical protein
MGFNRHIYAKENTKMVAMLAPYIQNTQNSNAENTATIIPDERIEVLPAQPANPAKLSPMPGNLCAHVDCKYITRDMLADYDTPAASGRHKPIPHVELVNAILAGIDARGFNVIQEQYAVSESGQKLFGVISIDGLHSGVRMAIGFRHSNDKAMAFSMVSGYKVFVCDNLAFSGDFQRVLRKHTTGLVLESAINNGLARIEQEHWGPMLKQIASWSETEISDLQARDIIYRSFIEAKVAPIRLIEDVHQNYFSPKEEYKEAFGSRTLWSLSNAFTETFKDLQPLPHFKATASLGTWLDRFSIKPMLPALN